MKVVVITRDFPNIFGGISEYVYHLCNSLVKEGFDVFVLTSKDENIVSDNGVKVLKKINKWNLTCCKEILKTVNLVKPDVIILQYAPYMYHSIGIPFWLTFLVISFLVNKYKLVTIFHEVSMKLDFNPKYFFLSLVQLFIANLLALFSNKVIVVTEYWEKLLQPFKSKIIMIPVGSNIIPFSVSEEERMLLRKRVSSNDEVIFSTFGSIQPSKMHYVFLKALKEILKQDNSFRFKVLFLGKNSYFLEEDLKKKISEMGMRERVSFIGYLDSQDIYKYLIISDVFFMLSGDERGGISLKSTALAAAFASGLPIIGAKGPLTDELFKDGENVLLLNDLQIENIASKIIRLVKGVELRNKLSKGALETYNKYLNWEVIGKSYKQILEDL